MLELHTLDNLLINLKSENNWFEFLPVTPTELALALRSVKAFFMIIVYILFSSSSDKFYTGHTQDLTNRLTEHNSGETKSIRRCTDWIVVWQQEYASRSEAMIMENKIKKRGARRFLQDLNIL